MSKTNSTPARAASYYRNSTGKQEDSIERQRSQVLPFVQKGDNDQPRYYLVNEYKDEPSRETCSSAAPTFSAS